MLLTCSHPKIIFETFPATGNQYLAITQMKCGGVCMLRSKVFKLSTTRVHSFCESWLG